MNKKVMFLTKVCVHSLKTKMSVPQIKKLKAQMNM